jgi:flagellar P-ring protein precursor FlgI
MKAAYFAIIAVLAGVPNAGLSVNLESVRLKDLGRIEGVRENSLIGYGLVTGLAGTGDSSRSRATVQSVANMLLQFGITVTIDQINSRNVAAVMVTATLPAFSRPGDKLDVNVSSLGDARSLVGGTLLMTPLNGPDRKIHALAQGPLSVGGFKYDLNGNVVQKNHPTAGNVPGGAIVELGASTYVIKEQNIITILLFEPDFTTASRIADSLNASFSKDTAKAIDAQRVEVRVSDTERNNVVELLSRLENVTITPDQRAKVIVNERTGTVVSGGDVRISMVTVSHGDLKVSIVTDYLVSQPTLVSRTGPGVRTEVVPSTRIDAKENEGGSISLPAGTTVADLVAALNKIKTSTRDVITILQGIKRAGALHAELIIQ